MELGPVDLTAIFVILVGVGIYVVVCMRLRSRVRVIGPMELIVSPDWEDAEDVIEDLENGLCFVFPKNPFDMVTEWKVKRHSEKLKEQKKKDEKNGN